MGAARCLLPLHSRACVLKIARAKHRTADSVICVYLLTMSQWKRSAECRLCECPVADTGVRMDQLDAVKLSEWWLQKLGVTLDPEDIAQQWICQFCLFDAK